VIQLQWLSPTVYPNLVASLGIEGRFKLWAEDPSAAPGRRFSTASRGNNGKAAFETRSNKAPYRSFSMKHNEETRHTYLALLAADGRLTVYENEQPENLDQYGLIDEFSVCHKPGRGEEVSFRVRFDPNPDPCYTALRAGVLTDSLGLVVAGMSTVRIYRSRDVVTTSYGVAQAQKEFYLAAEIAGHRGLVRDVAWAPGNIRGYDVIATACQDGFVRVFKVETPFDADDGKSWSTADLTKTDHHTNAVQHAGISSSGGGSSALNEKSNLHSGLSASLAKSGANGEGRHAGSSQPGTVKHTVREVTKLDSHRTPVWRVDFDDDGHILGSVGDDGKLMCYRQIPDGTWAKSSELALMKTRMAAP
jgi:nucleoporin SEH1